MRVSQRKIKGYSHIERLVSAIKVILCKRISLLILIISLGGFSQTSSQTITVVSPNGGENWQANSTHPITWTSSGVTNVKIEYSLDNGNYWELAISSATGGSYSWTVPDAKTSSAKIKITNNSSPFGSSQSGIFSIIADNTVVRIMPLGDSITNGDGDVDDPITYEVGYREELFNLLTDAGYNFHFVGSIESGTEHTPNLDFHTNGRHHEGHGGWNAYQECGCFPYEEWDIETIINPRLTGYSPDILLLHIGTNDINENETGSDVANQVKWFILNPTYINHPNVVTALAKIVRRYDNPTKNTENNNYNTELESRVDSSASQREKIIFPVDMYNSLNNSSYFNIDGLHPNHDGYLLMAATWFAALQSYYQPILAGPDSGAVDRPVDVSLSWNAPPAAIAMTNPAHSTTFNYELQVAINPDFSAPNIVYQNLAISSTTTSIQPTGLKYGTEYFWRVRIAKYGWSKVWKFTTKPLQVSLTVFLQGPYAGSNTMNTNLRTLPGFPLSQPYNVSPWSYSGTETVGGVPSGVVDWALVELRTGLTPATATNIVATRAVFIKNDGNIVGLTGSGSINFSGILPDNYYIVVKHRNHLAIMSSTYISINPITYDFTDAQNKAYTTSPSIDPMADLDGVKFGMIAGDGNADGGIYAEDYTLYRTSQGNEGYIQADYNLDGGAYAEDYTIYKLNQGKQTSVP